MRKSPEAGTLYNRQRTTEVKTDEIARRTAGMPEREPLGIVPTNQRLVRIENSGYPHSPAWNVMDFSFVDATYTATAGAQTLTPTDRGTDGVVLNLAGHEIPDQTLVMAYSYENDPRWYVWWVDPAQVEPEKYWQGYLLNDQTVTAASDASSPADILIDSEEFISSAGDFEFDDETGELLVKVAKRFVVSYDIQGTYTAATQTHDAWGTVWMKRKPDGGAYASEPGTGDDIIIPLASTPNGEVGSYNRDTAHKRFLIETAVDDTFKLVCANMSGGDDLRLVGRGFAPDPPGGLWVWNEVL